MKEFSVPMALVDYIPVAFFAMGSLIIAKDLKDRMSKLTYALFSGGATLIVFAGFFKATYKLLYASGVGDFLWMSNQFFSNQSLGFLLAGIGLTLYAVKPGNRTYAFLPTMALVGFMVIGAAGMDASLAYIANKAKKKNAMVSFIVSFFLTMMMGYLSSRDFDKAFMNWVAQFVNIFAQGLYYLGAKILHKAR